MKLWKKTVPGLLLVIVMLLAGVCWLFGTNSGLNVFNASVSRWIPGMTIGRIDGSLPDLTLHDVRYQAPGVDGRIGALHLELHLRCLLSWRLCINDLSLNHLELQINSQQLPASAATQSNPPVTRLHAPIALVLHHFSLSNVSIIVDDQRITLQSLTSGAIWQGSNITVTPTDLQGMALWLAQTSDKTTPSAVVSPDSQLQHLFSRPLLPELAAFTLPVDFAIEQFRAQQLKINQGAQLVNLQELQLQLSSKQGVTRLDQLMIKSDYGELQASGTLGMRNNWPVDLTLQGQVQQGEWRDNTFNLHLTGAINDNVSLQGSVSGALNVQLQSEMQLVRAGLPFMLTITSPGLSWPLRGKAQYQLDALNFQAQGNASDYILRLSAGLQGEQLPPGKLLLQAHGNTGRLIVDQLKVTALQGAARLNGVLDWKQALSASAELNIDGINSAQQYPDWPVTLDGTVKASASLSATGWQLAVGELQLAGKVKQHQLKLQGEFTGDSDQRWDIRDLQLILGGNQLLIEGKLDDKNLLLNASIHAPALDNVLPGIAGDVQGTMKLRGTTTNARLDTDIRVRDVRWQDLFIGRLDGEAKVNLGAQLAGNIQLTARNVSHGGQHISQLSVDMHGSEKAHQLHLRLQGKPVSAQLRLAGGYDRRQQRWRGALSDTRIDLPEGSWTPARDIALDYRYQQQKMTIGQHCWNSPYAQVCAPRSLDVGKQGRALVEITRFDLRMLNRFLPQDSRITGGLTGKADIRWDSAKQGFPQGSLSLDGQKVNISQMVDGKPFSVAFDSFGINTQLRNNQAQLNWLLRVKNNGQFDGELQVSDLLMRRKLSGNISINNFSLAIINPLLAGAAKATGTISAGLRIGGDMEKPQLLGELRARELKINGDFVPFAMLPGELSIDFHGMDSTLQGVIRTTQGEINLQGAANWQQPENWYASVAVNGDRVRISVPPVARLDVSPHVLLEASPQLIRLRGDINVPWARITVHELPETAVKVSDDVVMLDNNLRPIEKRTASIPVNSDLKIHIGNDVQLDAFGLKAHLTGNLLVTQGKQQALGLSGQIDIPQGRFRAYGQDLLVRRGELLFSGSPDHVLLNVEAIRNPQSTENNVIAGVRVTGSSDEPKVEVFSDPAMSQQEALSYLLRGQGLESQQSDGAAMTSALIGLGVAQSGLIVGKIGETFGIKNLALDTESVGNNSQVVLSGYVLPGLQVKYGVGIFDSLATLTLRYRLLPKLYLEAVSGVDQALDVLYQFEF